MNRHSHFVATNEIERSSFNAVPVMNFLHLFYAFKYMYWRLSYLIFFYLPYYFAYSVNDTHPTIHHMHYAPKMVPFEVDAFFRTFSIFIRLIFLSFFFFWLSDNILFECFIVTQQNRTINFIGFFFVAHLLRSSVDIVRSITGIQAIEQQHHYYRQALGAP